MKTERRHELQTNQLANWIGNQYEHVKPHGKTILAASILGAAVIIAAVVILNDRDAAQSEAWNDFHIAMAARDPAALADVAKKHSGTAVALWAKEAQADLDLQRGIEALYTNREESALALNDARKAYTDVIQSSSSIPELQQKALYGMAKAQEASGNLDGAKDYYQQLAQKFPDSVPGKEATARVAALNDPETARFYSWFTRQKPRASSRSTFPNLPGMPGDMSTLPDSSNLPPAPDGGPLFPAKDSPDAEAPLTRPLIPNFSEGKTDAPPESEFKTPAPEGSNDKGKGEEAPAAATPAVPAAPATPATEQANPPAAPAAPAPPAPAPPSEPAAPGASQPK